MIITVTVNPAADQTLWVDRVEPGSVRRVFDSQIGHVVRVPGQTILAQVEIEALA
jgi:fructose-1-phosphate kinase PfkB-like protein